jgi:hypothetical protein
MTIQEKANELMSFFNTIQLKCQQPGHFYSRKNEINKKKYE